MKKYILSILTLALILSCSQETCNNISAYVFQFKNLSIESYKLNFFRYGNATAVTINNAETKSIEANILEFDSIQLLKNNILYKTYYKNPICNIDTTHNLYCEDSYATVFTNCTTTYIYTFE